MCKYNVHSYTLSLSTFFSLEICQEKKFKFDFVTPFSFQVRAVLKNAAIAFFVPVFFTFIYNRTVYDIMSKSIVVEVNYDLVRQRRRRQNNNNH